MALPASLSKANLVPGAAAPLIPSDFRATVELGVSFGPQAISLGNLVRNSQVTRAPRIKISSDNGKYLLMLIDPDAPTPDDPKFAFWRHWVVSDLTSADVDGKILTEYLSPGPKPESKPHRYLFLLFRQPADFALTKGDVGGEEFVQRRSFDAAKFVSTHGLQLAGVNWMTCAADEWAE